MSMWRLLHKLFGWHYVWVQDLQDHHISRVRKLPNGELMGKIVGRKFFINQDGKIKGGYLITDWVPLTWNMENKS